MSGYCIDHDKHFLDTCPSCQEKKEDLSGPVPIHTLALLESLPCGLCSGKKELTVVMSCFCLDDKKKDCLGHWQAIPCPRCLPTNPERSEGKDTIENGLEVEAVPTPNGGSFTFTPPKERCEKCHCKYETHDEHKEHPECFKDSKTDESIYFDDMVEAERILEDARSNCWKKRCPQLWCQDQKETIAKALSRSRLSSRQSAIESCVKAVENINDFTYKLPAGQVYGLETTDGKDAIKGWRKCREVALRALRLLREESEDKKDVV